jgi:LCP family protein required for cell wall assembly
MKKQNSGSTTRLVVGIVLAVVLVVIGGAAAFVNHQLNKINRIQVSDGSSVDPEVSDDIDPDLDADAQDTVEEDALDWGEAGVVTQVDGVCNILLIGQDTRVSNQRGRSDSMILFSINKNTNQMTMVSLMRDMYVQIPDHTNNKINAAFAYGGVSLLDETIATNFGIQIDYNVEVDFEGFKDVIDTLGGVDIDLYQAEVDYLNKNGWDLQVGTNHLTGAQALAYSRIRYVGNNDFERTQRQRAVLTSIFQSLKGESLSSLLSIYSSVAGNLYTDMTNAQILSIATSAYGMIDNGINSYRIPTDDMYRGETIRKMSVLVIPDWDYARSTLQGYLYGEDGN